MSSKIRTEQDRRWRRKDWYWQSDCGRYRIVRLPVGDGHKTEAWRHYESGWRPIRLNMPDMATAIDVCRKHAEKRRPH